MNTWYELASPNSSIRNSGCASLSRANCLKWSLDQVLGLDVAVIAGVRSLEGDQRRASVPRDRARASGEVAALDVDHVLGRLGPAHDVVDARAEGGVVGSRAGVLALD
jgi:hypothetical protein